MKSRLLEKWSAKLIFCEEKTEKIIQKNQFHKFVYAIVVLLVFNKIDINFTIVSSVIKPNSSLSLMDNCPYLQEKHIDIKLFNERKIVLFRRKKTYVNTWWNDHHNKHAIPFYKEGHSPHIQHNNSIFFFQFARPVFGLLFFSFICLQLLLIYHSNIHQFPWWGGEYENRPLSPTTLQTFMLYGSIALHNNFAFKILSCYIAHHKTKNAIRNPQ